MVIMKKVILISLFFVFSLPSVFGQVEETYLKAEEMYYVQSKPKAVLYDLTSEEIRTRLAYHRTIYTHVTQYNKPVSRSTKKVAKPTSLKVIGYGQDSPKWLFDTYLVVYDDKIYILEPGYVEDNSGLEARNRAMQDYYTGMKDSLATLKASYDREMEVKRAEIQAHLDQIKYAEANFDAVCDSIVNAKVAQENASRVKVYNAWYSKQTASTQRAAKLLAITQSYLDKPNSAGGCDYYLRYVNHSKKTIKYLTWYGSVYNAVNDRVSCTVRRIGTFSGKDTGPVAQGESGGGYWDCIIYNYSAKEMRLSSISIIYMDGSTASIAGADIRALADQPLGELSDAELANFRRGCEDSKRRSINDDKAKWLKRSTYAKYPAEHNERGVNDYFFLEIIHAKQIKEMEEKIKQYEVANHAK